MATMDGEPTPRELGAWRAFLVAHARVVGRLERELEGERGMPLGWYDVLVQLSDAEKSRLRMFDLASAVVISRAGLTRLIDRIEAAALVERLDVPGDRRGRYVAMTATGRAALDGASPIHLRGVAEHFTSLLSPTETHVVFDVMTRVATHQPPV